MTLRHTTLFIALALITMGVLCLGPGPTTAYAHSGHDAHPARSHTNHHRLHSRPIAVTCHPGSICHAVPALAPTESAPDDHHCCCICCGHNQTTHAVVLPIVRHFEPSPHAAALAPVNPLTALGPHLRTLRLPPTRAGPPAHIAPLRTVVMLT